MWSNIMHLGGPINRPVLVLNSSMLVVWFMFVLSLCTKKVHGHFVTTGLGRLIRLITLIRLIGLITDKLICANKGPD